ncbi:MAG: hypothetical protein AAGC55_26160, partial [Myxococcota bacterium]
PVGDRAAFIKAVEGTSEGDIDSFDKAKCKLIKERYVCSDEVDVLAVVGQSDALAQAVKKRPLELRGHIEMWGDMDQMPDDMPWQPFFNRAGIMSAAMVLERGAFTVRGHLAATPTEDRVKAFSDVSSDLANAVAAEKPAGMLRVSVPFGALVPRQEIAQQLAPMAQMGALNVEKDILDNVTGEMVMYSPPGDTMHINVKFGVRDGKPLGSFFTGLCALAKTQGEQFGVKHIENGCTAEFDPAQIDPEAAKSMPWKGSIKVELRAEERAVVASLSMPSSAGSGARKVDIDGLGKDLMTGSWNWATWSRGLMINSEMRNSFQQLDQVPEAKQAASSGLWALAHISELGAGFAIRSDGVHMVMRVETQFANPDKVVREFQGLADRIVAGDSAAEADLAKLAESSPDTALARAHSAGQGGFGAFSGAAIGVLAAVAIPAFMKYIKKSKTAEASMFTKRLYDGARQYYMNPPQPGLEPVDPHFPRESVGPTPAPGSCCKHEGGRCPPNPT